MITISNIGRALERFFEAIAKARVNSTLLGMGRERVEQLGYSYEALLSGPDAWPWRKTTQDSAATVEIGMQLRGLNEIREIPHTQLPADSQEIEKDAA